MAKTASQPTTYDVKPATAARFADVTTILGPKKAGAQGCWCLAYLLGHTEESKLVGPERAEHMASLCRRRVHAPGVLAYADGEVVGWAGIVPRSELHEYTHGRRYGAQDDVDAWTIYCLRVRAGLGRRGVATALIEGAVAYAASKGAPAVDAYPVDNDGAKVDRTLASVGTRPMFERAGFAVLRRVDGTRDGFAQVVMRREL